MTMKSTHFPCVKGKMGDWVYYTSVINACELVENVGFAEEVCPNTDLDLMIQREVSARAEQIAAYLRTQDQRFFGALIVAAYDGQPHFLPVSFPESPILKLLEGKIGILRFDGTEKYYAIDGQHRLAALRTVINEDRERYKDDEVSVIVICHTRDAVGMVRARRLFTTVNKYAKKTSTTTNIVMDEDDGVALITRRLIREDAFFSRRTKIMTRPKNGPARLATSEAMGLSDTNHLFAIGTFYKCNNYLLPAHLRPAFSTQQQPPAFDLLEQGYASVRNRWTALIDGIALWNNLRPAEGLLTGARTSQGGHILARPIGITAFVRAASETFQGDVLPAVVSQRVADFSDLNAIPWKGLLWNVTSGKMFSGKEREGVACDVWKVLLNLDVDRPAIETEWRALVDPDGTQQGLHLPE